MAIMVRVKLGGTAKAAVYNASAATHGVCLVDEIALVIGTNAVITNRLKLATTINALEKLVESFVKRKKNTTLPGATDRVLLALSMTPAGVFQSPSNYTKSVVTAASAPVETNIGILIGSTIYGTAAGTNQTEKSAAIYNAFKQAINCYKQNFSKKN